MKKGAILFMVLFLVFGQNNAQNVLQGTWMGLLYQNEPPPFDKYLIRLELKQSGTKVWGLSHISVESDPTLFAEMKVHGIYKDGEFLFRESHIDKSKHLANWDWCLKRGTLTMKEDKNGWQLSGKWEGWAGLVKCNPGEASLDKIIQKAEPVVVETPNPETAAYGRLEGREITRQRDVEVELEEMTIYVWDSDKVDGDVISLSYNGKWLLRDCPLLKTKRPIKIQVEKGAENRLILFAENEGRYPPNTAALTFYDGVSERNLNLTSTKKTCGALHFILK